MDIGKEVKTVWVAKPEEAEKYFDPKKVPARSPEKEKVAVPVKREKEKVPA